MGKADLFDVICKKSNKSGIKNPTLTLKDVYKQWEFHRILVNEDAIAAIGNADRPAFQPFNCDSMPTGNFNTTTSLAFKKYSFYGGFEIINRETNATVRLSPKYAKDFRFLKKHIPDLESYVRGNPTFQRYVELFGKKAPSAMITAFLRLGPEITDNVYRLYLYKGVSLEQADVIANAEDYSIKDPRRLRSHIIAAATGGFSQQVYISQASIRSSVGLSLKAGAPQGCQENISLITMNLDIPGLITGDDRKTVTQLQGDDRIMFVAVSNSNRKEPPIPNTGERMPGYTNYVCLKSYVAMEESVAHFLKRPGKPDADSILPSYKESIDPSTIHLPNGDEHPADEHFRAAYDGFKKYPIINVTGKAGTGKSTFVFSIINKILQEVGRRRHDAEVAEIASQDPSDAYQELISIEPPVISAPNIILCSFTGKAVKVLIRKFADARDFTRQGNVIRHVPTGTTITIGTIHKLYYTNTEITDGSIVIVDETSMVDLHTFSLLAKRCQTDDFQLILVGDPNQLPPVSVGHIFRETLTAFPTFTLRTVHRTSGTAILHNADIVLKDITAAPILKPGEFTWERHTEDAINRACSNMAKLGNAIENTVLLAHRNKDVAIMNKIVQEHYAKERKERRAYDFGSMTIYIGDHVCAIKNAYQHDVFNGDRGVIQNIHINGAAIVAGQATFNDENVKYGVEIRFDGGIVTLDDDEVKETITLGYASTVHKSQGSEVDHVILSVPKDNTKFDAPLLYTGMTRAKKSVLLLAVTPAILNNVQPGQPSALLMLDRRLSDV